MPAPKTRKTVKKVNLNGLNLHSPRLHNTLIMIAFALPSSLIAIYYYGMYMSAESELIKFRNNPNLQVQEVAANENSMKEVTFEKPVKVLILNGTNTVGEASRMQDRIENEFSNFTIETQTGDALDLYEHTVVFAANEIGEKAAPSMVDALNARVLEKNDIENTLDADVLVIVGADPTN